MTSRRPGMPRLNKGRHRALRESRFVAWRDRCNLRQSNHLRNSSFGLLTGEIVEFENFYATRSSFLKIVLGERFALSCRASGCHPFAMIRPPSLWQEQQRQIPPTTPDAGREIHSDRKAPIPERFLKELRIL